MSMEESADKAIQGLKEAGLNQMADNLSEVKDEWITSAPILKQFVDEVWPNLGDGVRVILHACVFLIANLKLERAKPNID